MGFLGFRAVIPGFLVFALPIRNALGISSAQFAFVVGAAWAIGNVSALVAGWLADRYGGRQLVLLGGLISCLGFGAVAYVDDYWHLVLAYSVVAAIGRGIGIVPNLMTAGVNALCTPGSSEDYLQTSLGRLTKTDGSTRWGAAVKAAYDVGCAG